MSAKALILIGGEKTGTRFRPLSLSTPKVFFPIAGKPLLTHLLESIQATSTPKISEVVLIGFFDTSIINAYIATVENSFTFSIKYYQEPPLMPMGTAGGLYYFRDEILKPASGETQPPEHFFLIYADIVCSFPLHEMYTFANEQRPGPAVDFVIMGVPHDDDLSSLKNDPQDNFGSIASIRGEVVHYVEKPETKISSVINGGVYYFKASILQDALPEAKKLREERNQANAFLQFHKPNDDESYSTGNSISWERDLVKMLADKSIPGYRVFCYQYTSYWRQLKTASLVLPANKLYLEKRPQESATSLENVVQPCYIHPSSFPIPPTAKIGPYVSIGANAAIGPGVRIVKAVIGSDVTIGQHTFIKNAVVDNQVAIGEWCRVEGSSNGEVQQAKEGEESDALPTATVLATDTKVLNEVRVYGGVVLPHKELKLDVLNEIIM
ncbi:hypothetical protein BABINDRAFT_162527 [Babjeviella inositovora NRRL Y-12698]|uniref:mannose-1-phosphate guanylyltransferase n=1 Tax=Babjeviella inositovora NRRL Y-12698 TaxID=984486 RepID=A0A1E3QMJ2_9ASCO|nr:uncharacterized protein BABINDRAFT_162527 [Babjeviella inositovora NRRL Y-12698]ODQ78850.1 hypothetical protein BABINDRAFT_162527 [Babjeviella inositovora NRRL Y-12698]